MPIRFSCGCGRSVSVKDALAGKLIKCPACGKPVRVPADELDGGSGPLAPSSKVRAAGGAVTKSVKPPEAAASGGRSAGGTRKKSKSPAAVVKRPPPLGDDLLGARVPPVTTRRQTEFEIKPLTDQTEKGQKRTFKCPGCSVTLYEGDILCISCGMDLSTGQWLSPKDKGESKGYVALAVGVLLLVGLVVGLVFVFKNMSKVAASGDPKTPEPAATVAPQPENTAALAQHLAKGSKFDFPKVADELGRLREAAFPKLLETLNGDKSTVPQKQLAASGLVLLARMGLWGDEVKTAFQTLAMAREADEELRSAALQGLYVIGMKGARIPLDQEFRKLKLAELFKGVAVKPPDPAVRSVFALVGSETTDPLCDLAVRYATDCGDSTAIHVLISGLSNNDLKRNIRERYVEALRELTGDTSEKFEDWERWWGQNQGKSPVEWLVISLQGSNEELRARAAGRLKQLTGANVPEWSSSSSAETKARLVKQWQDWWEANKGKF
ncbi:MAG: hypothetical protein HYZ53_12070 [Planctomycetes bacterium]|nr:hypothetical protein [Planctomycetota bacterium]